MRREICGLLALLCNVSTVMRTLCRSVIEPTAKPRHGEVSVLCEVLGSLRAILKNLCEFFLLNVVTVGVGSKPLT